MASSSASIGPTQSVVFTTQTSYPLPSQKFMIPLAWKRYQLSQLINKALSLPSPIPFDFLVPGEILRTSLGEWCAEKGVGEEGTLEIEYFESILPPQKMSSLPHEDWVSSVSCRLPKHFLTASYDGHIRLFNYSQKMVHEASVHAAPITSCCIIPNVEAQQDDSSHLLASSSHDLTARISKLSLSSDQAIHLQTLASLHLHTAPLSSVSSDSSGSKLLTSSWDGLIGYWNTDVPDDDEVPLDRVSTSDRKKRRKVVDGSDGPKRKAPLAVLKSHTARVSKAVFSPNSDRVAYSCGFDFTVRTWDVELGICTFTINAPERPMADLALTSDGNTAMAASTDRTISLYDVRSSGSSVNSSIGTLAHPATPSCIAPSLLPGSHQLISGAYDGIARMWDLRSMKGAVSIFKVWDGKKILSVDWASGIVGVGGEGGMEVWRVGETEKKVLA